MPIMVQLGCDAYSLPEDGNVLLERTYEDGSDRFLQKFVTTYKIAQRRRHFHLDENLKCHKLIIVRS